MTLIQSTIYGGLMAWTGRFNEETLVAVRVQEAGDWHELSPVPSPDFH